MCLKSPLIYYDHTFLVLSTSYDSTRVSVAGGRVSSIASTATLLHTIACKPMFKYFIFKFYFFEENIIKMFSNIQLFYSVPLYLYLYQRWIILRIRVQGHSRQSCKKERLISTTDRWSQAISTEGHS